MASRIVMALAVRVRGRCRLLQLHQVPSSEWPTRWSGGGCGSEATSLAFAFGLLARSVVGVDVRAGDEVDARRSGVVARGHLAFVVVFAGLLRLRLGLAPANPTPPSKTCSPALAAPSPWPPSPSSTTRSAPATSCHASTGSEGTSPTSTACSTKAPSRVARPPIHLSEAARSSRPGSNRPVDSGRDAAVPRATAGRPDASSGGLWPRAAALLARQALEETLDAFWLSRNLPLGGVPTRPQLICLGHYLEDEAQVAALTHAWNAPNRRPSPRVRGGFDRRSERLDRDGLRIREDGVVTRGSRSSLEWMIRPGDPSRVGARWRQTADRCLTAEPADPPRGGPAPARSPRRARCERCRNRCTPRRSSRRPPEAAGLRAYAPRG